MGVTIAVTPPDAPESSFGSLDASTAAALLAVGGDLAIVLDAGGVIRAVHLGTAEEAFASATGWIGRAWQDTVTTESRPKIDTLLKEAARQGLSKRRQVNIIIGDLDAPVAFTALRLGKDGQIVAVGRDLRQTSALQQRLVEAQQAMERDYWRLRHVETRYRLLFQLASDGILVLDAITLKVLEANHSAGLLFGEATDQLAGRTMPFGVDALGARNLEELVATARNTGRAGDITVGTPDGRLFHVSASCFRQEAATLILLRFSPADLPAPVAAGSAASAPRLLDLLQRSPDAFVVTDLEGIVVSANQTFLDVAEAVAEEQVRGTSISTYLGRPGADFSVFTSMLRRNGVVRLMATSARGVHGHQSEVEVSAVWVPEGDQPCIAFTIRDIGRRLAGGPHGARDLTRAVEELTGLVGRVSLRDLVRDTVDLMERHFIEAALELTNDNRTSAAEVLGVSRQSLYVKMRRHKLAEGEQDAPPTP